MDILAGAIVMLAIAFGLPWAVVELAAKKGAWRGLVWLRALSFFVALIVAGAWLGWIAIISGTSFVVTATLAGISGAAMVGLVTYTAHKRAVARKAATYLITFYGSLGVGCAFALAAAPTDDTGLWGVGLIITAAASLGLGFIATNAAYSFFSRFTSPGTKH